MKINRTFIALVMVFLLAAFTTACQRNNTAGVQAAKEKEMAMSQEDRDIATKIEEANQGEMNLAEYAKGHAVSTAVKDYANMLTDDHTRALRDIVDLVKDKDATVVKPAAEAETDLAKLQTLSGTSFDTEYMNMTVANHQKTLDALNTFEASAQNKDLKDYIRNLIPTVQKHLEQAQNIQTKLMKMGTQ